jgi:hypothetical protein
MGYVIVIDNVHMSKYVADCYSEDLTFNQVKLSYSLNYVSTRYSWVYAIYLR